MSFNFEFVAEVEDAKQIVGEETAPIAVKDRAVAALTQFRRSGTA